MRRLYELRETHPAGSLRKSTARLLALVFTLSLCLQQVWAAPEARTVIPLGKAVGIKLFADGALVVGLSEDGPCPARDCGLKEGDLILTMGDAKITSTEQVRQVLQDNGCEPLALTIRRGSRDLRVTAVPTQGTDGAWQLGAWIRDSMAGIVWIAILFPENHILQGITASILLKFFVCGITSFLYFRIFIKKPIYAIIGSLLYTFSSFTILNTQFNHFTDVIALFPLITTLQKETDSGITDLCRFHQPAYQLLFFRIFRNIYRNLCSLQIQIGRLGWQ